MPGTEAYFDISRTKSILALENAMESDRILFLSAQYESEVDLPEEKDIRPYGVYAKIETNGQTPRQFGACYGGYRRERQNRKIYPDRTLLSLYRLRRLIWNMNIRKPLKSKCALPKNSLRNMHKSKEISFPKKWCIRYKTDDANALIDLISANIPFEDDDAQLLLEKKRRCSPGIAERKNFQRNPFAQPGTCIMRKVKTNLDDMQKSAFINEQIRVLQEELGDRSPENIAEEYLAKLHELNLSEEITEKLKKKFGVWR